MRHATGGAPVAMKSKGVNRSTKVRSSLYFEVVLFDFFTTLSFSEII
jgi:hypothetical protein